MEEQCAKRATRKPKLLVVGHDRTMTKSKWSPDEFRNKKYAKGWKEIDGEIEGWGKAGDILRHITHQEDDNGNIR